MDSTFEEAAPLLVTERRTVNRHRVRESIRQMIVGGKFKPGARLVQGKLADELEVSRGVVREAMLELQAFGLVETVDNRGAIVSHLNKKGLIEAYEIREMLKALAARRCCERITMHEVRELRELVEQIYHLHGEGKRVEGARLDHEFHSRLIRIADHRVLERVSSCFWMLGKVHTGKGFNRQITRDAHLKILQDIEAGDADAAERSMRLHLQHGRNRLIELFEDPTFRLEWLAE
jgi:GntR family transcriptional regulator, trigonelline degradation regulator